MSDAREAKLDAAVVKAEAAVDELKQKKKTLEGKIGS